VRKPDDHTLSPQQLAKVRAEAERALRKADALGVFPTPVAEIMRAADVVEVADDVLNESFVDKLRREVGAAGGKLKSAFSKVLGLFDARGGLVFISRAIKYEVKRTFVRLHEAAHGFLAWQRPMYAVVEDCENSLDPDVADQFDREANVFASEVLFQLGTFNDEAEGHEFNIMTPVRLHKKYGGSIYSTIRRYVSGNWRACTVVVLNQPQLVKGDGFRAELRRAIASPRFAELFGQIDWKDYYTPDDALGRMVPIGGRRATGKRPFAMSDRNGDKHECVAEAFTQGHQVFILIHAVKTLTAKTLILPKAS
jgi:hypothetical protein